MIATDVIALVVITCLEISSLSLKTTHFTEVNKRISSPLNTHTYKRYTVSSVHLFEVNTFDCKLDISKWKCKLVSLLTTAESSINTVLVDYSHVDWGGHPGTTYTRRTPGKTLIVVIISFHFCFDIRINYVKFTSKPLI